MEAINSVALAIALAASGRFKTASQVRAAMVAEGYPRSTVHPLFEGASFTRTLRAFLKAAHEPELRQGPPDLDAAPA